MLSRASGLLPQDSEAVAGAVRKPATNLNEHGKAPPCSRMARHMQVDCAVFDILEKATARRLQCTTGWNLHGSP